MKGQGLKGLNLDHAARVPLAALILNSIALPATLPLSTALCQPDQTTNLFLEKHIYYCPFLDFYFPLI